MNEATITAANEAAEKLLAEGIARLKEYSPSGLVGSLASINASATGTCRGQLSHSYQPLNMASHAALAPDWVLFCSHCGEVKEIERPKSKE